MNYPGRFAAQAGGFLHLWSLAACSLVLLILFAGCSPPNIDDLGGYRFVYDLERPPSGSPEGMEQAVEQRLRQFGFRGATATMRSDGRLELAVPGAEEADVEQVQRLVEPAGVLEFRILAKPGTDDELIAAAISQEAEGEEAGSIEMEDAETSGEARWVRYDADAVQIPADAVTRMREEPEVLVLMDDWDVTGASLLICLGLQPIKAFRVAIE